MRQAIPPLGSASGKFLIEFAAIQGTADSGKIRINTLRKSRDCKLAVSRTATVQAFSGNKFIPKPRKNTPCIASILASLDGDEFRIVGSSPTIISHYNSCPESDSASSTSTENSSPDTPKGARSQSPSRKGGHGRMGAGAYTGARVVRCRDAELTHGARCPHDGCRGKLYDTKQPAIFIRLTGQPLVGATRYVQEVLRCSACQERFTAPLPAVVKPEKYDETCDVSLALAKYGAGTP
jgi:hypothetical protein